MAKDELNQSAANSAHIVCIVDPSVSVRASLTALLEDLALIHAFDSGELFLRKFAPDLKLPSLLITESRLPGISGLILFDKLNAQGLNIPTIILATHSSIEEAVRAMRAGVHDYFEKPFDAFKLRGSVELALHRVNR